MVKVKDKERNLKAARENGLRVTFCNATKTFIPKQN